MKKLTLIVLIAFLVFSCKSGDKGQLVGAKAKKKWYSEKPFGTVLIPGGSFTMGKQDEDIAGSLSTPARTVTVTPFYMDETEITNSEYRQFVFWVRDSIIRTKLAMLADEGGEGETSSLSNYKFKDSTDGGGVYYKYMMDNYGSLGDINSPTEGKVLDWTEDLVFDTNDFPDASYAEVMDSMFLHTNETFNGKRILNADKVVYSFFTFDNEEAARHKGKDRASFIKKEELNIYPDTTVWVKDFNYSYNDPMHQDYFSHSAYDEYPVVGVSWKQAEAFCHWRTRNRNTYLSTKKNANSESYFRLPAEAEWEFAARGGYEFGKYPWGNPYPYSDRGCFLANFKPQRGDYALDGALYTMEGKSYNANGYGLYNMAGNVAEWTNTAYNPTSYLIASTMNPNVEDKKNHRKVIRGGSWKDVAYFLEVSTRDFEYGDTARSFIGFRTVQDYHGKID